MMNDNCVLLDLLVDNVTESLMWMGVSSDGCREIAVLIEDTIAAWADGLKDDAEDDQADDIASDYDLWTELLDNVLGSDYDADAHDFDY